MIPALDQLWNRLKKTGDSEPEQAIKLRLTIGFFLVIYFCLPWSEGASFSETIVSLPSLITLNYYLMAIFIAIAIILNPRPSPVRRVAGTVLDLTSLSVVMYLAGDYSIPLFVLYLWVMLGNGFRYGTRYLYISLGVGLAGFIPAIIWGTYWIDNQSIAISLLIILCVLPLYSAFLLEKLHAAIDSAKQANEAKSRFLANMSHELRTPLNGVIGMGELLRETDLSFEQHELINSIHSSANTLLELIENVLDISKIEAGKLLINSKPFDLHALITSVRYILAPMGERKGLTVSCHIDSDTPFSLIGDQTHLRQVLINLINNAIKFTDEGSVSLNVFQKGGTSQSPRIRFEVKDSGIGIDSEAQQRIFENFTQADASSIRSYGGTGLGTTISRDLVELMGGEIGVISDPGQGSLFWVELPFKFMPKPEETLSHNKILLLAGEETASIIRPSLRDWSIEYHWARSAARAFSFLVNALENNQHYEIVIVDQQCMQDVNPVQFAQMVKAEKELESLSMILVNSSDSMVESNMVNKYYITMLDTPQDKRLLFNALHAAQSNHANESNVVTLSEHYARQGSAKGLDILVAEDNVVNQQVIEGILKHAGHKVRIVDTGEKTLDVLSEDLDKVDLLILDMNMPEKSGVEVVKALRFMESNKTVPVIMLTADATPEAKEKSMHAGANCFLTKPVDARVLLEKVAVLTRHIKKSTYKKNVHSGLKRGSEEKFQSSPWFTVETLWELSNLGDGVAFVRNLIKGFEQDGQKHISNIKKNEIDDYPAYRESLHALKGSSTELGAHALVDICLEGESLKPFDMGTEKIKQLNLEVEHIFNQTVSALKQTVTDQVLQNSPENRE